MGRGGVGARVEGGGVAEDGEGGGAEGRAEISPCVVLRRGRERAGPLALRLQWVRAILRRGRGAPTKGRWPQEERNCPVKVVTVDFPGVGGREIRDDP